MAVEAATEAVNAKLNQQADKVADKVAARAERHLDKLEQLDRHFLEVWTRHAGRSRKPRLSRGDIARTAVRIADEEGLEALSMRRLAAELDVGTMSIYHYVRTKDELMTLVMDELMGEICVPERVRMPKGWREAVTLIARHTRDALQRHPWVFDITDDPPIGPNSMRHADQTMAALAGLDASTELMLDLMMAVDEYVFGYCLHARNNLQADESADPSVMRYMEDLLATGEYPALRALVGTDGFEATWRRLGDQMRDSRRFERNLDRLLDGFEAAAASERRGGRGR